MSLSGPFRDRLEKVKITRRSFFFSFLSFFSCPNYIRGKSRCQDLREFAAQKKFPPRFLRRAASLSYYSPILAILSFPSFSSYTILHCKSSSSRVILLYFYLFHPPVPLSTKLLEFFDRNFRLRVTLSVSMFEVPGSPLAISVDFLRAVQSLLSLFSSL